MQLSIISFTEKGKHLSEDMAGMLKDNIQINNIKMGIRLYTKCKACSGGVHSSVPYVEVPVGEWAGEQMGEKNAMLFIGACGIAVRAVAPFLTDKLHDAPVLVMDEKGRYIIPILSGHMGGANELANSIAAKTGAEPVITTATDINQKFAVDLFAKKNGLYIANKDGIAKVSSKVLAEKEITMAIEPEYGNIIEGLRGNIQESGGVREDGLPMGVRLVPYPPAGPVDIVITSKGDAPDASILLKPREYVIGIGCKRGKSLNEIGNFIEKRIGGLGISVAQVAALSSISQKHDEQGIIGWCRKEGIPFLTYTAQELQEVRGDFTKSSFVKAQVGVDNVCERAALKACGGYGTLIAPKYAENGITIAVARKWRGYGQ